MKKLPISQDSPEWHKWRKTVLGGTDASIIMGVSPYCKIDLLRLRKLGLAPEQEVNEYMRRGKNLEDIARKKFCEGTGIFMEPACIESSEYPFLGCSLDGISPCGKYILEIKVNGEKNHKLAKKGKIPKLYEIQCQKNILVSEAEKCYYFSYFSDDDAVCIEVLPDPIFKEEYLPKAEEFWMSYIFYKE